ncbi:LysR family transcriptional regulator [Maridesulfovibrio sp. FT414]|uniref:LysR family transcriptional regulator n=1 Tax=Maridesulfovibrio sp. FT414 TaxID=2979469 RepID=UPI003D806C67
MEIRNFLSFKTVVEQGSFIKAAQSLNYAQSSITSHVQALEEYYGQPVFDRLGKKVQLNSFGKLVYQHALVLLSSYEDMLRLKHKSAEPSGTLRIGVPESTMLYRLSPVLQRYKTVYPKVEVVMQSLTCPQMRQELRESRLDMAIILDRERSEEDLVCRVLSVEPMALVMPRDYPADDLIESGSHAVLYTEQGCSYRIIFENLLRERGFRAESIIETASVEVIKQYILCNIGVSFLPLVVVRKELDSGLLKSVPWNDPNPVKIQLVRHKDKWISPAMFEFIRIAEEEALSWKS